MALEKSIDTDFGIPATYWKITDASRNYYSGQTQVSLKGYVSQQAREDGKAAITYRTFNLPTTEDRQALYDAIKLDDEFTDALDV